MNFIRFGGVENAAFRTSLVDDAQIAGGPVHENGFAVDKRALDGAEIAAVRGDGAMVAHHEVAVGGDHDFSHGAVVAVFRRHVGLAEGFAIDNDATVVNAEAVAGDGDDALDIALFGIARIVEDHDVAVLDGGEVVDKFVDKEAIAVFKAREHAGAFNTHGLVEKRNDKDGSEGRDEQVAEPENNAGRAARADGSGV